jgi:hypothetical protein
MNTASLIITGVAWLVIAIVLVLDFSGRWRRYPGFRWIGASLLLIMSSVIFSEVAHDRSWPIRQLETIDSLNILTFVPAAALGINGYRLYAKSRRDPAASRPLV